MDTQTTPADLLFAHSDQWASQNALLRRQDPVLYTGEDGSVRTASVAGFSPWVEGKPSLPVLFIQGRGFVHGALYSPEKGTPAARGRWTWTDGDPRQVAAAELQKLRQQKDRAYTERNLLAALLARKVRAESMPNASAGVGTDSEMEPGWSTVLFIDLPTGQISFHLHDSEKGLVMDLDDYPRRWDGHTDGVKWDRVRAAYRQTPMPADGGSQG